MFVLPFIFLVSTYLIVFYNYFRPHPPSRLVQRSALLTLNASVLAALAQSLIPLSGAFIAFVMITLAFLSNNSARPVSILAKIALGTLALAVSLKLFGWQRVVLNPSLDLGNPPFEWVLNFDKPFAGAVLAIALLMLTPPVPTRSLSVKYAGWIALGIVTLVCTTFLLGGTFAPKWTLAVTLFLITNLIFAVVPEELFFRSLLQAKFPKRSKVKDAFTVLTLTGLFTLAHFSPKIDPTYLVLVALAGGIYAFVFQVTRSILWAIAIHLFVNLLSVALFNYPLRLG